jgi:ABC-type polysaccharide/polyol phosphate transport system ATPase subunit
VSAAAVEIDGVSKQFTLYHQGGRGLKERLLGWVGSRRDTREAFWALSDVSFSLDRGQTLGLIGPNGCGKSTLLQIIAGILIPDRGRVAVRGRVTSLLELGAGFSPDLSGRDNVFLNASLHGVDASVIRARFDDIVAFAELERFIDTPVRNYSSGMYMRLGFSVAAHLDPEIVLVDEALAVGDESFQRKCLRKIQQFQQQARA